MKLEKISKQIYELKDMITITEDLEKVKELEAELKYQALIYIDKIKNLKN